MVNDDVKALIMILSLVLMVLYFVLLFTSEIMQKRILKEVKSFKWFLGWDIYKAHKWLSQNFEYLPIDKKVLYKKYRIFYLMLWIDFAILIILSIQKIGT